MCEVRGPQPVWLVGFARKQSGRSPLQGIERSRSSPGWIQMTRRRALFDQLRAAVDRIPPRRPPIYLAVILQISVGGSVAIIVVVLRAFVRLRGIDPTAIPNLNGMLISLPILFLWIPVSLVIANVVPFHLCARSPKATLNARNDPVSGSPNVSC